MYGVNKLCSMFIKAGQRTRVKEELEESTVIIEEEETTIVKRKRKVIHELWYCTKLKGYSNKNCR